MCNSNNLRYTPQKHEFRAYRADGTIVQKGDELVTRGETWNFSSCTHPRKIYVGRLNDPKGPDMWPNKETGEYYASVFNLGIYDMTDDEWTFLPSWDKSDIDTKLHEEFENRITNNLTDADVWASYDKNIQADKFPNSAQDIAELEEMDKEAPLHKTDMWELIDQMFQRVTQCDGTVILTPRAKSDKPDNLEEASEANLPWVTPGPSESEKAEQADRVRRADAWVETGVLDKTDVPYKHYDLGNQGNRETYTDEYPKAETPWEGPNYDEPDSYTNEDAMRDLHEAEGPDDSDIADEDDKGELVREADEQAELDNTLHPNMWDNKA